jgi:nicotinate-nucleotide adenylyltransferase
MTLGLLGGTFDPIHFGHLRAAENARVALGLDQVLLMPAGQPPHRDAPVAPALDRYAMVALAAGGHSGLVPSDLELRRDGPSYTVDSVAALKDADPEAEIVLILGSDQLPTLPEWREPRRLLEMCTLAVVERPGVATGVPDGLPRDKVRRVPGSELAVSSRDLRRRIGEGGSVRFLVPDAVADYIAKRGLYR